MVTVRTGDQIIISAGIIINIQVGEEELEVIYVIFRPTQLEGTFYEIE